MKSEMNKLILRDVEALAEVEKLKAVAFIKSLRRDEAKPPVNILTANRLRILEDINKLASEIGGRREDADAADLISSMRR